MYISRGAFDHATGTRPLHGTMAWPGCHGLGELRGTHSSSKSFPDPNECWDPRNAGRTPDWNKTVFTVEATLEVPAQCDGSIIARTTLRDPAATPGMGASNWHETIRFGVSDGTDSGGLEKATRVSETEGIVEFATRIPWDGNSCTAGKDTFVYVKYFHSSGPLTFVEIGFYPRVKSDKRSLTDQSPNPVIRLNPCDNLIPIRSRYVATERSKRYWKLPPSERQKINRNADRLFREETGIARKLDPNRAKDRPLLHHWLRTRDSVMSEP